MFGPLSVPVSAHKNASDWPVLRKIRLHQLAKGQKGAGLTFIAAWRQKYMLHQKELDPHLKLLLLHIN